MAGALDTLIPDVKAIVDEFGKTVIFKVPTTGATYDPNTGGVSGEVIEEFSAVVTPPDDYSHMLRPGTTLREGELQIGLPASGLTYTPTTGWKVEIDSRDWTITDVMPIYSGELIAIYFYTMRGGN